MSAVKGASQAFHEGRRRVEGFVLTRGVDASRFRDAHALVAHIFDPVEPFRRFGLRASEAFDEFVDSFFETFEVPILEESRESFRVDSVELSGVPVDFDRDVASQFNELATQ